VCEGCRHFAPDPINPPAGMGQCMKGSGYWHPMAPHLCRDGSPPMSETHAKYAAKNIVCLRWAIGTRVRIIDSDDAIGTVYSVTVSKDGIEYSVRWFNDGGGRCQDWFMESELEPA
jgi:hypothetical protein